jgi:predicted nucleotidyltransferase
LRAVLGSEVDIVTPGGLRKPVADRIQADLSVL